MMENFKDNQVSNTDVKNILKNSYNKEFNNVGNFMIDPELSGRRVKVYHNKDTNQTITAHRGTQGIQDIITDAKLLFGFKNNKRFKHADKIQKQAEEKYRDSDVTTLGHSLGGAIASKVGKKSDKVITVNGAVAPTDIFNRVPKNQVDYRSNRDLVSIFRPLQKGSKVKNIKAKTFNLLSEHKVNILDRKK